MAQPAPTRLGRYRILRKLGEGGMGFVWLAEDERLGRRVALKTLRAHTSGAALRRFEREALSAGRLQHPAVVTIHDVGREGDVVYLAMELIDGETLEQRVAREGRMPGAEVAQLGLALARGLAHAHRAGVLHRDIKPANVLLLEDGSPKLTDFGLARPTDRGEGVAGAPDSLTSSGQILGTPAYMAPEQARGDKERVGVPTDIYGLGGTLYEAATGRPPLQEESFVLVVTALLEGRIDPPRSIAPDLDPRLERIILRCLAHDPSERYPTAEELIRDLESWSRARSGRAPRWLGLVGVGLGVTLAAAWGVRPAREPAPEPGGVPLGEAAVAQVGSGVAAEGGAEAGPAVPAPPLPSPAERLPGWALRRAELARTAPGQVCWAGWEAAQAEAEARGVPRVVMLLARGARVPKEIAQGTLNEALNACVAVAAQEGVHDGSRDSGQRTLRVTPPPDPSHCWAYRCVPCTTHQEAFRLAQADSVQLGSQALRFYVWAPGEAEPRVIDGGTRSGGRSYRNAVNHLNRMLTGLRAQHRGEAVSTEALVEATRALRAAWADLQAGRPEAAREVFARFADPARAALLRGWAQVGLDALGAR